MCIEEFIKNLLSNQYMQIGFSTFVGAITAFLANWIKEYLCNRNYEKNELIKYFYNLHFVIRNFAVFINNVNQVTNWQSNTNIKEEIKNKDIPLSQIDFNFNEEKLNFVCVRQSTFYENIMQLKTELKVLHENAIQYNNMHNIETINEITNSSLSLCPKISATLKNVDKYLRKYYWHKSLIKGEIEININKLNIFFENSINSIKEKIFNDNLNLKSIDIINNMELIEDAWNIDF